VSARTRLLILAATLAAVLAVVAVLLGRGGSSTPDPAHDAAAYLAAWQEGDGAALDRLVVEAPDDFADRLAALTEGLAASDVSYELGDVERDGDEATATFTARMVLAGLGEWSYEGELHLVRAEGDRPEGAPAWLVDWSPAAVHPDLAPGQRLVRTRERPERAPILDAFDRPLVTAQPAVHVGIQPSRVEDREQVKAALADHLGVDPGRVDTELDRPGVQPDHFVPIVVVPRDRYEQVRAAIYPVPGLVFQETTRRQAPSEGFARHVLGTTGEVTAELLAELGPTYQAGDIVGLSGLEARFEEQLAGTPSGEVRIVDEEDEVVAVVGRIEGTAPRPVATTLDPAIQQAVENALGDSARPAAAVVVDTTGSIRALASRPLDEDLNRAIGGAYPPGSTFKVITTSALLSAGVTPDTAVECPPTVTAGGRSFRNFEGGSLGSVPFRTAFAESCNTAFIALATDVPADGLTAAAEHFGFNTDYSVGLRTLTSTFPTPADAAEHAAAAIGQGRVLATPVHMAAVGAAVADGTWEPPTLVREPTDGPERDADPDDDTDGPDRGSQPGADGTADDGGATGEQAGGAAGGGGADAIEPATPRALPDGQAATLRTLMRAVVTGGSGTAADVPGAEIFGKTGTAEFGSGDPPPTHAWFIGVRGDLSVAVLLEDGGVGGRDAAPVAGRILGALPG